MAKKIECVDCGATPQSSWTALIRQNPDAPRKEWFYKCEKHSTRELPRQLS